LHFALLKHPEPVGLLLDPSGDGGCVGAEQLALQTEYRPLSNVGLRVPRARESCLIFDNVYGRDQPRSRAPGRHLLRFTGGALGFFANGSLPLLDLNQARLGRLALHYDAGRRQPSGRQQIT
jgi:hypothetical protein